MSELTEAEAVEGLARQAASPSVLIAGDVVSIIVPENCTREEVDTEYLLAYPTRKRGNVSLHTPESFCAFVVRHKETECTTIYASKEDHLFVGVLNDSYGALEAGVNGAQWTDHRAALKLRLTPEWKFWADKDGALMDQTDFALHVENGADEVREPDAATLLELAQTFQAKTDVKFRSSSILASGQRQLQYEENVQASAGLDGKIVVPAELVLGIAPFEGSEPYKVTARLRYRLREGKLSIGYQLVRPHEVLDAAFGDAQQVITEKTEVPVFMGTPPQKVCR